MAQRVLWLGLDGAGKSSLINRLKAGEAGQQNPTQSIDMQNVEFNGMNYQLCEIGGSEQNRHSYVEHSQNASAIVFVVDNSNEQRYPEVKEFLQNCLQDSSLAGVPVLCYFNRADRAANIKKAVAEIGLSGVSDREIFVQACDAVSGVGVNIGFDWVSKQLITQSKKQQQQQQQKQQPQSGYSFNAEPKVVKGRPKYKQEEQSETKSQQTFTSLMQDRKVKMMNPVQQEQEYVRLEKERIKIENMNAQLINFKKNKKRMAPYDIKPSPNPRIDVNLEFFLTDNINTIPPTAAEIDCQTDEFIPKPPSPKYVPKKTGIDAYTQVEDYELFDFDREVTPIVNVIVTKTLEQSMLEIEQDEELLNMRKFKKQYEQRQDAEKKNKFGIYEKEVETMVEKDKLLDKYALVEMQKKECLRRVQNYSIAKQYLRDIKVNATASLFNAGFYQNTLKYAIQNEFVDWLVDETSKEIEERRMLKDSIDGLLDAQTLHLLKDQKQPHLAIRQRKLQKAQERRVNDSQNTRLIRICYKDAPKFPSHFSKHILKYLDGQFDEWRETYNTKSNALQEQVDSGEITEEQKSKTLEEEFPEAGPEYFGLSVNSIKKLGFTLAHSQFYVSPQKEQRLELVAIAIHKDGSIACKIDAQNLRQDKYIRYKRQIRDISKKVADDEAIVVDFTKIPADVSGFLFFVKLPNLSALEALKESDQLKYSRTGVEDYSNNIAIDNLSLMEKIQFDQLIQQPPSEDSPTTQNGYYFAYALTNRPVIGWHLENIKIPSKGMFDSKEEEAYINKIVSFWTLSEGVVVPKEQSGQLEGEEQPAQVQQNQAAQPGASVLPPAISTSNVHPQENANLISLGNNGGVLFQKCYKEYKVEFQKNPETGEVTANGKHFEEFVEELVEFIKKEDSTFDAAAQWGMEFYFRGKAIYRLNTLRKCKNAVEFEVKKKPEPIVEKVEDEEGQEDGEGQEDQQEQPED